MERKFQRFMRYLAVIGGLTAFLLGGEGMNSKTLYAAGTTTPLKLEGGLLTGQGSDVPLRDILDQLHRDLGITYEVPVTELDKRLSYDFRKESLSTALTKLLASWDFAFSTGPGGQIQTLFITPKIVLTPEERLSREKELAQKQAASENRGRQEESVTTTTTDHFSPGPPGRDGRDREFPVEDGAGKNIFGRNPKEGQNVNGASVTGVMPIRPPSKDMVMPISPASGSEMNITPPSSSASMQIIPPTAYPPMTINPVPDHLKAEMLGAISK